MKIGIIGKICSGKTTLADRLIDYYKHLNLKRRSFSGGVYHIAKTIFGMVDKDRKLLQSIGTKMREIDEDIWIKNTNMEGNVIIDDIRYNNELNYLIKEGFIIIHIKIDKLKQIDRIIKTYPNSYKEHLERLEHESERLEVDRTKVDLELDSEYNFNEVIWYINKNI